MTQRSDRSLIAIVNARSRQNSWADAVRQTWLSQVPEEKADVLFFVGRGEGVLPEDTVALDCDDSYQSLPEKVRAIIRWADAHKYEHTLKLDDDVVIRPNSLLSSGYDAYPYSGRANRKPTQHDPFWVPMGFAYWLRRDMYKYITDAPLPPNNDDERWVAGNLHKHNVTLKDDKRYHLYTGGLKDIPPRINRPLRIGTALQDTDVMRNGFAWCVFYEIGAHPPRIPVEVKIGEFTKLWNKYGEQKIAG